MNLYSVLEVIKGNVICDKAGEKILYESGNEARKQYSKYYEVVSIAADSGAILLEIADREPEIRSRNEKFLSNYKEKNGKEFSYFDS